jgi:OmpA-OmpF porin, OOP family
MNGKALLAVVSMASFTVVALPATAQDSGVYVGAGLGISGARQVCANTTTGGCDDRETSLRLFGGYQLHRNLGVEGGYQYFGTFSRGSRGLVSNALDVVAVGSWPFTQELSAYAKLGAYLARTSSAPASEDNSGFVYGVGAEWTLNKDWGVRGEWQRYNNVGGGGLGFNTDIDVISASVVWRPRF